MVFLVLGAVLVWIVLRAWKYFSEPQQAVVGERSGKKTIGVIAFTTGLFIFTYLGSIVASMTMFDAATKFRLRILSPVLVGLLILLVYFGVWLRNKNRAVVIVLTFII